MLNNHQITKLPKDLVNKLVKDAIAEDISNDGDITANLVTNFNTTAYCITREDMVLCGQDFANEVISQIDSNMQIKWFFNDADNILANETIFEIIGNSRSILTAERTILNFIQMLSATATTTQSFAQLIAKYNTKLLDTRKTIPGFRLAQKYAVRCGGGYNHRIGLFDAYLIKENHIRSANGIKNSVSKARQLNADKLVEVEVANLDELEQAIQAQADIVMLDNFSTKDVIKAVDIAKGKLKLEVSGNIDSQTIVSMAETGIDFISVGAITKHIKAIDLSLQIQI